ncbi:hypothetical protein D918_06710 [Trichuris suis]|nr:hypothetical protein D918_06710 [Trichuris suis]
MDRSVLPPFEQSDWAAPIVIPKKTEQTVSNGCVLDPSPEDLYQAVDRRVNYSNWPLGARSPVCFQRTMDMMLEELPHVAIYLDDKELGDSAAEID